MSGNMKGYPHACFSRSSLAEPLGDLILRHSFKRFLALPQLIDEFLRGELSSCRTSPLVGQATSHRGVPLIRQWHEVVGMVEEPVFLRRREVFKPRKLLYSRRRVDMGAVKARSASVYPLVRRRINIPILIS